MIFLYQRVLTHYQVPIFKKLNELLDDRLVLAYGQPFKKSYLFDGSRESLPFKKVCIKNIWLKGEKAVWQNFLKPFYLLGKPKAVIMEGSPRILSIFPFYLYCKIRRIPFVLWGHGGSRKRKVSESFNVKDMIHRWLIRKADAYICYTDGIKEELSKIKNEPSLFVARNTMDTETLFKIREKLAIEGKDAVKERLGLERKYYICFIGRLLPSKRVDYLIDVYTLVKKKLGDSGLLIIGDGPEKNFLKSYARRKRLSDVHFLGGIYDWEQSGRYLYASDVMVMPGYVGLTVNHAFCFGMPIVTQAQGEDGPFHSPEVEYIANGETGFICPNGDREKMERVILDVFGKQKVYNETVTQFCKDYLSIDLMVLGMKEAIEFVTKHAAYE